MLQIHSLLPPRLLHPQPMLRLILSLLDPQLFEKHIRRVIHLCRGTSIRALLLPEVIQLRSTQAKVGALGVHLRGDIAQEFRLRYVGVFFEVGGDFAADLVAGIEDGDGVVVFPGKVDVAEVGGVVFGGGVVGFGFVGGGGGFRGL